MNRFINILFFVLLFSSFAKGINHNVGCNHKQVINYITELEKDEKQDFLSSNTQFNSISEDDNELEKFHFNNEPSFIEAPSLKFNTIILTSSEFHIRDIILFESDTSPPILQLVL